MITKHRHIEKFTRCAKVYGLFSWLCFSVADWLVSRLLSYCYCSSWMCAPVVLTSFILGFAVSRPLTRLWRSSIFRRCSSASASLAVKHFSIDTLLFHKWRLRWLGQVQSASKACWHARDSASKACWHARDTHVIQINFVSFTRHFFLHFLYIFSSLHFGIRLLYS